MRPIARVLFDESHRSAWSTRPEVAATMNPVNPADASYAQAAMAARQTGLHLDVHQSGPITGAVLAGVDVLVLPHGADDAWEHTTGTGSPILEPAELSAIEGFVRAGGGLVILAETEQAKYGNNLAELAQRFGITIDNLTVQDPGHCFNGVPTWVLGQLRRGTRHDLTARVDQACFYRAGALRATSEAVASSETVAQTHHSADPPEAALIMAASADLGRVVVTADSDLFGDDSIMDLDHRVLWVNLLTWAAGGRAAAESSRPKGASWLDADGDWRRLVNAVEQMRTMQASDGSIDQAAGDRIERAAELTEEICGAIEALAPRFPHQSEHLALTIEDFRAWRSAGFAVPDFTASLRIFRPDLHRIDGIEHLAVFPMYTQNGNPNRNVEAVVTRTFWPDWLATQEAGAYDNAAFVPIEFVGFTKGYDTHSAVFFPETVATSGSMDFHWGGIFCDREAARFRMVQQQAAQILRLSLPPDLELLINDQRLAQETFVLWDLIHDRTHSRGDLPFDPFMIKQRMPFWMYALEELRCDLVTYRETVTLQEKEVVLAPFIRYAIVLDRLFRFTVTGDRVRNYDGLAGQIIFAWLHRDDVLRWTDNTLSFDWNRLPDSMIRLCDEVETLYREGIDRSRLAQWMAAHEFVGGLVAPHPASAWARGADGLALDGEIKELVDAVLPDEFPLNVFYEALKRKLTPTIDQTAGITA